MRNTTAERIVARKQAVPEAESQENVYEAAYGEGLATIGGTRRTSLCSAGQFTMMFRALSHAATGRTPHSRMSPTSSKLRLQAVSSSDALWRGGAMKRWLPCLASSTKSSDGFHTRKRITRARMQVSDEIILVTCTPTVFRMKNSVTPNASPHRIAAGRTPFRPFHPHITSNRYDGTITESGARIHAVAALKWSSGRPVVAASVTIGMPSEPNATGAVLAIRAMAAAENGENPSPASIAAAIAIGVPKPAAPAMKAPKANAIKMACNLRSSVKWPTESLIISNLPLSTIT